jgi:hypothetical protein
MKFNNYDIINNKNNQVFKILLNFKWFYRFVINAVYLINKNRAQKKRIGNIVMLHNGRVGSTVLADIINQHSDIHWDGEIFTSKRKTFRYYIKKPLKFLKLRISLRTKPFYGFEIKAMEYQQIRYLKDIENLNDFLEYMSKYNFNYIILLKRNNYLRQYISLIRARQLKIRHTDRDMNLHKIRLDTANTKIGNNINTLFENFKKLDAFYNYLDKILKNKNYLKLEYENDIMNNPLIAYKKVCNYLQVNEEDVCIRLKKTNPFSVKDSVENFEDLENELVGTQYEWMLYS